MLQARGQSTAELQQQHVDRLNRHTIHTTSAGMAHANSPTARATVNSTSWWWGQEQRVVLNFVDADTTQKFYNDSIEKLLSNHHNTRRWVLPQHR